MAKKNRQIRWLGSHGYWQIKLPCGAIVKEHRLVWEEAHGPIPAGYQIHHRNHDRTDNCLSNLECVDTVTHKRLHAGHLQVLRDNIAEISIDVAGAEDRKLALRVIDRHIKLHGG